METVLRWDGPFEFTSRRNRSIVDDPRGDQRGIYCWGIQTDSGLLAHYVGETGTSFARRHVEHFEAYACGRYGTRDAEALSSGEETLLFRGTLWKRDAWRLKQTFIDGFSEFASHLARGFELIEFFIAPLEADLRVRRRIEGGLVRAFYSLPEEARTLFPSGYRVWDRRSSEDPIQVRNEHPPPIVGFPEGFSA